MRSTAARDARVYIFFRGGGSQLLAIVFGSYFLSLPVHPCGVLVVDLHAIHAYVALAGLGVARDHAREGDEAACVFAASTGEWGTRRARSCHGE